ncbi:MAG: polysaccharide biosynthesis tyrosine autokinase, partial [Alphaproteobacteria bacterium]
DVIRSAYIAGRVVDKLKLTEDPLFNPSLTPSVLGHAKAYVKSLIFGAGESQEDAARAVAVQILLGRYSVSNPPRSFSIFVTAQARDAEMSATLANAIADEYLKDQLETRFNATKRAGDWLGGRLEELRDAVRNSEQAVQKFREENNLYEQEGVTLNDQQMSELNSQLILARTSRAEAEAKLGRIRQLAKTGRINSAGDVLSSNLIQRLREQEAEVQRKVADLSTRYGAKHPELAKVKAELTDLRGKIGMEVQNILGSLESDVEIARSREIELQKNLTGVQKEAGTSTAAEVKLAELTREASANRQLYESFLNRSKETNEQVDLEQADARLVARAEMPLKPSYPKKTLVMLLALFAGMGLGLAVALVLERLDNGFRTPEQVEQTIGLRVVGQVPLFKHQKHPVSYILEKPTSSFAESIRSVRTALHFANPDEPAKVVLITSSVTNEGKSTFASAMGALAAKGGQKVVLVDCDMRRPGTSKMFNITSEKGLGDLLVGDITRKALTVLHPESGLHIIPARADTPNSNELLGSKKMKALLAELKAEYDLIILDSPPVSAVADPLTLAEIADTVLFVVRWAETARNLAQASVRTLVSTRAKITGIVLTQVDVEQSRSYYGYGYGYHYTKSYYND